MQIKNASIADIPFIQRIAYETWPIAYKEILSTSQLGYMLDAMYSQAALADQFQIKNHQFLLSYEKEIPFGFASYSKLSEDGLYKLHKLYVLPEKQSKGHGKFLIDYIINNIKTKSNQRLCLNVNRNNNAVQFYLKQGFVIKKEEDIDIGNGYFMNDYVMEKRVS